MAFDNLVLTTVVIYENFQCSKIIELQPAKKSQAEFWWSMFLSFQTPFQKSKELILFYIILKKIVTL